MKKNSKKFFIPILAIAGVLLAGCSSAFNEPSRIQKEGRNIVRIIVSGEGRPSIARTVVPENPEFTYTLIFTNGEDKVIRNSSSADTSVELGNGNWELRVEGKNDGVTVGESDTIQFAIGAQEDEPVTVTVVLHPLVAGLPDGNFRYDIQFDSGLTISEASLVLTPLSGGTESAPIDLIAEGSGNISLAPGYYRLAINAHQDKQIAVKGEIVHIYSGIESGKGYIFTAEDFADEVVLGGKIEYPGYTLHDIIAYENAGYDAIGWAYIDGDNWDVTIPASHEKVYLIVELLKDDGTLCHSRPELYPADGSSLSVEGNHNITLALEKFNILKNPMGNGDIEVVSESFEGEWIDIQVKPNSARLSSISYIGTEYGAVPKPIPWQLEQGFTMPLADVRIDAVFEL